ncbi:hypothetical protein RS030_91535 [Cryptosporidium xiaoi]|uniref:Symplekin C-terminal domain-containing protein n=1 Tax=Cryptosporidium xiaoi TaxID=659607 RepID=A0AAV9XSC3_9CRYT
MEEDNFSVNNDVNGGLMSFFLQTALQRRINGLRLKSNGLLDNGNTNRDLGTCKTREIQVTRFLSPDSVKQLDEEYIKGVNISNEMLYDRFDSDYKKRINVIKCMEKIIKSDSVYTSVVVCHINSLTNDLNINVAKSVVDFIYNNIDTIIPNLILPYSIKNLGMEKDKLMYESSMPNGCIGDDFKSTTSDGYLVNSNKKSNEEEINNTKSNYWWDSKLSKELKLASNETLDSFFSLINFVSSIIETYGKGYYTFDDENNKYKNTMNDKSVKIEKKQKINYFQIDNDWKVEVLYRKALKLVYKILRICMLDTGLIENNIKYNTLGEIKNRVNSEYWDYPNNHDVNNNKKSENRVLTFSCLNGNYTYINNFNCLLPIEIFLCGNCIEIFERIVKIISISIDNSGKYLLYTIKENNYLLICYWIQFVSWITSNQNAYLSRFSSIIKHVSEELLSLDTNLLSNEGIVSKDKKPEREHIFSYDIQNDFKNVNKKKLEAVKFVFKEELLRILGSHNYNNIILFGEISNILNKLGKTGSLYELRREAVNKFKLNKIVVNNDGKHDLKDEKKREKDENDIDYPPIQIQKMRSKSTKHSYKRIKYDLENGFYRVSPQSVFESVSWLFSTNTYSNVIDMAINNFLNVKIPNNLLKVDNKDLPVKANGILANRNEQNSNLLLSSSNIPWTNKFSPLLNSDSSDKIEKALSNVDSNDKINSINDESVKSDEIDSFEFNYKFGNKDNGNLSVGNKLLDMLKFDKCKENTEDSKLMEINDINLSTFSLKEKLMNSICVSDYDGMLKNVNSMKSIIFSQIITSVLVTPVVDVTPEGVYTVSKSLNHNNQLMNVLKYSQLALNSWELLLKRIRNSEHRDKIDSNIESYGRDVHSVWCLFNYRMNNAFDILEYKYKILIRVILNKRIEEILKDHSKAKLSGTLIEILIKNLISETKEFLISIFMVSNIYNDEYLIGDPSEDYYLYLDGVLYHDNIDLCGIREITQEYAEDSNGGESGIRVKEISIILLLWVFNYILEKRVKIIHNLLFRFYYICSHQRGDSRPEFYYSNIFEWFCDNSSGLDTQRVNLENGSEIDSIFLISSLSINESESKNEWIINYNKLFNMCLNGFVECFSEYKMRSEIFLNQLKNLVLNGPIIPIEFLRLLYNEWIFQKNEHDKMGVNMEGNNQVSCNLEMSNNIKRDFAINILSSVLNLNYPIEHLRKISFYALIMVLVKNETLCNIQGSDSSFLNRICVFNDSMDDGTINSQVKSTDTEKNELMNSNLQSNVFVRQNFFVFLNELFFVENVIHNKKINIHESKKVNDSISEMFDISFVISGERGNDYRNTVLEGFIAENNNNWGNPNTFGEKWPIFISLILITKVIPNEIILSCIRVKEILGANNFIGIVACNLTKMLIFELNSKNDSRNFKSMEYIHSIFGFNISTSSESENRIDDKNEIEDAINYTKDIFANLSGLFKYYCLKYPCLINLVIYLCNEMDEQIKKTSDKNKLGYLNVVKELYIRLFEEIVCLFKIHYSDENGNSRVLMNEYRKIIDIYKKDVNKYKFIYNFILVILNNVNLTVNNRADIIDNIYEIFNSTRDINMVIPVIGHYDLNRIKELLPVLINKSNKSMIKECIKNILVDQNNLNSDRIISPSELLILLISYSYPNDSYNVDKKKTVDVIDSCFELTQQNQPLFESETIASVIGKFVQDNKSVFPRTLGRTLVLSILYIPSIRPFIATFVISSLIRNCSVWEDTLTWRGVKHCIQKLWSDYKTSIFPSLILLPQTEFKSVFNELIETNSDLRVDCLDIIKKTVSFCHVIFLFYSII